MRYIGYCKVGCKILLHPEFDRIHEYVFTHYKEKFHRLAFVTNSTVLPSDNVLRTIKETNCYIYISDYSPIIGKRSRIQELEKLLVENGINYQIFHSFAGGNQNWYDLRDHTVSRSRTFNENMTLYHECSISCFIMYRNKIYLCGNGAYLAFLQGYAPQSTDFFDVCHYHSKLSLVKSVTRSNGFPALCDRCDSMNPLNQNLVPAGEQVM